jgi:hypothetical protein
MSFKCDASACLLSSILFFNFYILSELRNLRGLPFVINSNEAHSILVTAVEILQAEENQMYCFLGIFFFPSEGNSMFCFTCFFAKSKTDL